MPCPFLSIDLFKLLERSTLVRSIHTPSHPTVHRPPLIVTLPIDTRQACVDTIQLVYIGTYIKKYITRAYIYYRRARILYIHTYIHTCTTVLLLASITFRS